MTPSTWVYVAAPVVAWVVAGSIKFAINSLLARRPAFDQIGYGGLPSTHMTIVSTMATLIAMREGMGSAAFGAAIALMAIVGIDALSLRRHIGLQARSINEILRERERPTPHRERIGHSLVELAAGVIVGIGCAAALHRLIP